MSRKTPIHSKPLTAAVVAMSLSLLGTGVHSANAQSVPPASFINYHVDTVQQLSQQVELDPAVRARLARHFHLTGPQLVSYINKHLKLKRLSTAKKYRVYCVDRHGREFFIMTRLPAGTPVFVSKSTGQPILKLACGNPMVSVLPHADMESDTGPGTLKGKKKQLADNLTPSPFDTLNGHNAHSGDSDIISPGPGEMLVTKNIPDTVTERFFTPPQGPGPSIFHPGGFSPIWLAPVIIGGLIGSTGNSTGNTTGTPNNSTTGVTTTGDTTTGVTTTGGTTTGGTTTGGTTTGGTTTGGTTTGGTTTGGTTTGGTTTGVTTTGGTTTGGTTTGVTTTGGTTTGVTIGQTTGETTTGEATTGNTNVPETGSAPAIMIGVMMLAAYGAIRRRRKSF